MTVTARGHKFRYAWGKQTAEGTPQATPGYETSGYTGAIKPNQSEVAHQVSDTDDLPVGYYKERADSAGALELASDVEAAPSLWAYHLGTDTKTGVADPYTHTLTKADAKSFVTFYQLRPDIVGGTDRWERMEDGFVRVVELRATKGSPLRHYVELIGKTHTFNPTASPSPTKIVRIGQAATQLLSMKGSVLKLDLAATPAVTTIRTVETLTIRSEYVGAEWIQTDDITPRFFNLGEYHVGFTASILFDSFAHYASTFFGSATVAADMALSALTVNGAADFLFNIEPTINANRSLEVQLPSVRMTAELGELQPAGPAIRVNLTAKPQKATSGETVTVIGKSSLATVY